MITGIAVVPGAPALVPELMGAAAPELDDLRAEAAAAVREVVTELVGAASAAGGPGRLIVLGPSDPHTDAGRRSWEVSGQVSFSDFGPRVELPPLPGAGSTSIQPVVPTALLVARSVLARVAPTVEEAGDLWDRVLWRTVASAGEPLEVETTGDEPTALVAVGDGAACHGPKAPRAEDDRAGAYDDQLARALASGEPRLLNELDPEMGRDLGSGAAPLWPLLGSLCDTGAPRWRADLRWRGAPYGVGWFVARWSRDPGRPTARRPTSA